MAISISLRHWLSFPALICIFLSVWQAGIAQNPQTGAAGALSNQYLPGSGGGAGSNNQNQPGNAGNFGNQGSGGGAGSNNQYQPGNSANFGNQYQPETGNEHADSDHLFSEVLQCFDDKQIYSSCGEAFRLSASGDIHVPPASVDEYCSGPCLSETHFVLGCIEDLMSNFKFYNEATVYDIKATIKSGCERGPTRGDFNVAEHIQADNSGSAWKTCSPVFLGGLVLLITAWFLLL